MNKIVEKAKKLLLGITCTNCAFTKRTPNCLHWCTVIERRVDKNSETCDKWKERGKNA